MCDDDLPIYEDDAKNEAWLRNKDAEAAWDWFELEVAAASTRYARAVSSAQRRGKQPPNKSEWTFTVPLDIGEMVLHDGHPKELTTGLANVVRNGRPRNTRRERQAKEQAYHWARKARSKGMKARDAAELASKTLHERYGLNLAVETILDRMNRR